MLSLTVTCGRVADTLNRAADHLALHGWDPERRSIIDAAAEDLTLRAWDALVVQLGEELVVQWERHRARTQAEVLAALRGAAEAVRAR